MQIYYNIRKSHCVRIELNSTGSVWYNNMATISLFWCENTLCNSMCSIFINHLAPRLVSNLQFASLSNFEITLLITPWIGLHLDQLLKLFTTYRFYSRNQKVQQSWHNTSSRLAQQPTSWIDGPNEAFPCPAKPLHIWIFVVSFNVS